MLKKAYRITKNKDFQRILKNRGNFLNNPFFLIKFIKNNKKNSRFGFVVSAKVSKKAVSRNLLKRRMREIIRLNLTRISPGYDIVFILKKDALVLKYSDLKKNVLNSLKKINLLL